MAISLSLLGRRIEAMLVGRRLKILMSRLDRQIVVGSEVEADGGWVEEGEGTWLDLLETRQQLLRSGGRKRIRGVGRITIGEIRGRGRWLEVGFLGSARSDETIQYVLCWSHSLFEMVTSHRCLRPRTARPHPTPPASEMGFAAMLPIHAASAVHFLFPRSPPRPLRPAH